MRLADFIERNYGKLEKMLDRADYFHKVSYPKLTEEMEKTRKE